ncbi:sortilin-related receptor-like [Liolophura sinensis]|uniref:sortilin-related receptor-like n=1 Tax=Liolophura sinensis TaxID=3198878 RepID=UPI003158A7DD
MGGNLYWVDAALKKIEVARKDGRFRLVLINGTQYLDKPRAIALDPQNGYMYWTDWSTTNPRIMKASMDGDHSTIQTIVNGSRNVYWPNGLAIDHQLSHLYWTDAHLDRIMRSDLNGQNRVVLVSGTSAVPHPYSIAVYKDLLYWSDWSFRAIVSADKLTGQGRSIFMRVSSIMDIKVLNKNSQQGTNPCSQGNAGCSQLCLARPSSQDKSAIYTCKCGGDMTRVRSATGQNEDCVCPKNERFVNNTCMAMGNHTCAPHELTCTNYKCVPLTWKCDHDDDCGDGSDETNCGYHDCGSDMFTCDNRHCISKNWVCDHDDDCHDGSDERKCHYRKCDDQQFSCSNGRCIPMHWKCDLDNDCHDGSDEENCTLAKTCSPEQVQCDGSESTCISPAWICDGGIDCPNGTDEQNCHSHTCNPSQFACNNSKCVMTSFFCDGHDDCGDNSDEPDSCRTTTYPRPVTSFTTPSGPRTCPSWHFQCENGHCLWWSVHCDGVNDCGDFSDEVGCPRNATTTRIPTAPSHRCGLQDFTCNDGKCLHTRSVCDGYPDCRSGEDEEHCIGNSTCPEYTFSCENVRQCIKEELVCNGHKECLDGSDEHCNFTTHSDCQLPWKVHCRDGDMCVEPYQMCDDTHQCYDESDEGSFCDRQLRITQLKASAVTPTSLHLQWKPPSATGQLSYIVAYINLNNNVPLQKNFTASGPELNITQLTPFNQYRMFVYVKMKNDQTEDTYYPGSPAYFRTKEAVPECPDDLYIHQDKLGGDLVLRVVWKEPAKKNGRLVMYKIFYQEAQQKSNVMYKPLFRDNFPSALLKGQSYSFVLASLTINTKYYIWVTPSNKAGDAKSCDDMKKSVMFGFGYMDPVYPKVVNKTSTSITLGWSKLKKASGYYISYTNIWHQRIHITVSNPPVNISGLSPGFLYTFVVQPYNASQNGTTSTIEVNTKGTPLKRPKDLTVDSVNPTSMKVSWTYPTEQNFTVFYDYKEHTLDTFTVYGYSVKAYGKSVIIPSLLACETYIFAVAVTGPPKSDLSAFSLQRTDADRTAPPKYVQIKSEPGKMTCFRVTWESSCRLNVEFVGYIIEVVEVLGGKSLPPSNTHVPKTNATQISKRLCNGTRGAQYRVRVRTTLLNALFSETVSFTIKGYTAPKNFKLAGRIGGNLKFTWIEPNEDLPKNRQYMLQYQEKHSEFKDYNTTSGNSIEFPRALMHSGASYTFRILLYVNGHRGESSNELTLFEQTPSSSTAGNSKLIAIVAPICAVVVILVIILLVYVVRHHRLQRSFLSFARSHYDTRSGTTTFTSDDLGEDEDSPMITGFSDDEPLVLA